MNREKIIELRHELKRLIPEISDIKRFDEILNEIEIISRESQLESDKKMLAGFKL